MFSIRPFLRDDSFEPETVKTMSEAFDRACAFVRDASLYEALAGQIVSIAQAGERDADKLAAGALARFLQPRRT